MTLNNAVDNKLQLQFEPSQSVSQAMPLPCVDPGATLAVSPKRLSRITHSPVNEMAPIKKILTHPSAFCIQIPVFKNPPCNTVIAVNRPTARTLAWASLGSTPTAKKVYLAKTMQLLAVNPSTTACTATSVDARNRGRG